MRSRARWHEHSEKSSKHFLSLEKRNHIRKYIRKLSLSGVIHVEFYKIMRDNLADQKVEVFNYSFQLEEVTTSQRQAIITLIDKKEKMELST